MVFIKVRCLEWADLDKLYYIQSISQPQVSCRPGMLPRCPQLVLHKGPKTPTGGLQGVYQASRRPVFGTSHPFFMHTILLFSTVGTDTLLCV